jgi:hypothetical protein
MAKNADGLHNPVTYTLVFTTLRENDWRENDWCEKAAHIEARRIIGKKADMIVRLAPGFGDIEKIEAFVDDVIRRTYLTIGCPQ